MASTGGELALSATDSLAALAPLIGAGGISGIIIAVLGYLKAAREGRKPALDVPAQVGIATLYAEAAAVQAAGHALERLAGVIERLARAFEGFDGDKVEKAIDELRELRRAVEDLRGKH